MIIYGEKYQCAVRIVLATLVALPLAAEPAAQHQLRIETVDSSREPLPGVEVALLDAGEAGSPQLSRHVTDAGGEVAITVGTGSYLVRATLAGFLTVEVGPLVLDDGVLLLDPLEMVLTVAPQGLSVICSSAATVAAPREVLGSAGRTAAAPRPQAGVYSIDSLNAADCIGLYPGHPWRSFIEPEYLIRDFQGLLRAVARLPPGSVVYIGGTDPKPGGPDAMEMQERRARIRQLCEAGQLVCRELDRED